MSVADTFPWKRGGSPHTPSHSLLCQPGVLWEHTREQFNSTLSNKTEDADMAKLADVFQASRTAIPALPFPLYPAAVWCLCFNPQRAKCRSELLSVQHYRVHVTSPCSAFILLQPWPPFFFFFNLPLLFPLYLSLTVRGGIPVTQRASSFLLPGSGICSFETKAWEAKQTVKQVAVD